MLLIEDIIFCCHKTFKFDVELVDDAWICWGMSRTLIMDSTWKILVLLPVHFFLFLLDNWCGGSLSAVLFYEDAQDLFCGPQAKALKAF